MKKGVSARDMSLSIGQNEGYINHIENMQAMPSLPVFFNICEYFEITPAEFFSKNEDHKQRTQSSANLFSISGDLKSLTPEQLTCIHLLIQELKK